MKLKGWKKFGESPVYEHKNGTRVHASGMVRRSDGEAVYLNRHTFDEALLPFFRLFGWNRRRAYIAYADVMFCGGR